ncbi:unnamed protein product, partial [Polarella glacialis]
MGATQALVTVIGWSSQMTCERARLVAAAPLGSQARANRHKSCSYVGGPASDAGHWTQVWPAAEEAAAAAQLLHTSPAGSARHVFRVPRSGYRKASSPFHSSIFCLCSHELWVLGIQAVLDRVALHMQKIFVKTYGCAHNNSDSEFMMGLLKDYGYTLVERLEDADACVVNSCTVKGPSQDSATNLVNAAKNGGKPVVLAGCVPSADAALVKSMEGVSMLGVTQLDRVVEIMEEALKGHSVSLLAHRKSLPSLDLPKVRKNKHVEIIPISGGCLGNCSYCKTKHAR